MTRALAVRAAALYGPVLITLALAVWRRPDRQWAAGALLATLWNVPIVLALCAVARNAGWWTIAVDDTLLLGVPADLLLGWVLLWGAIPVLALPRRPVIAAIVVLWADIALMPLAAPVVMLGAAWPAGEAVGALAGLLPGLVLAHWTRTRTRLAARAGAQVVLFSALAVVVLPAALLAWEGRTWTPPPVWQLSLLAQLLAVPGVLGLAAVQELVARGGGTPLPWDPPERLVTSGPYAYVANPMQLAMTVLLAGLGAVLGSWPLLAAAGTAALFAAGTAAWHEDALLGRRFGSAWATHRARVRPWLPSWRPRTDGTAMLYASATCDPCSTLAGWLAGLGLSGLALAPAEALAPVPRRLTYVPADGSGAETGVRALARALEHVNLGWAILGWCLRLPVVDRLAQLVADAAGAGPRTLRGTGDAAPPPPRAASSPR